MRKLFYLGFCAVLISGVGCAITNYALITDNDQGNGTSGDGTVNTNGKAKLLTGFQVATIWPDGTDELFSMVDQKANGDRTLTTYNNYNPGGAGTTFLDDTYCTPDWNGCSIWTADDPESGDASPFDGAFNTNCNGARSLQSLLSSARYYGECGRGQYIDKKFQAIANLEINGHLAQGYIGPGNTTLLMQGVAIPVASTVFTWEPGSRQTSLDLSNAAWYQTMAALENVAGPGEQWQATVIWNGIRHDLNGRRIDDAANLTWRY